MTPNNSDQIKKAGRPNNSVTCRRVKLKDINKHIGEEGTVLASQRWLQNCGIPYEVEVKS